MPNEPISNETLDEVERALGGAVAAYDTANPVRFGDFHRDVCDCLRCWRDRQEAALARLREERKQG